MNNSLFQFVAPVLVMQAEIEVETDRRIEECRKAWRDSMKLPRKKKKAARKKILSDFQFYMMMKEYDPFKV